MIIRLSEVTPEERAVMLKTITEMNQRVERPQTNVFKFIDCRKGKVVIQLSDLWGGEGLELLYILLRQLERFQGSP